jgi:hypothetical protein
LLKPVVRPLAENPDWSCRLAAIAGAPRGPGP